MRLFADSASDLPKDFFENEDVVLFPLRVHIGDQDFEDIRGIQSIKVFDAIRAGNHPKTSQVSPEEMLKAFEQLAIADEEGLYIAFSSELSGTYSTAVMVADQVREDYPDLKLSILDSKAASLGYGLLVKEAVKLRSGGHSLETILEKISFMADHLESLFTVEDLDYMAKGGRISKGSAFVGGLLNIKPLLHVEDGKLVPIEKLRGRKKVIKRMIELMQERGSQLDQQTIAISHGDDEEFALILKQEIEQHFNPKEVEVHMIGSVIAAHTGPGTLALFFLNKIE
ncbi:DegV family protein [Planococcus halocryophilus Or1]|uniref:Fatty acid-binding protein DegV n=1 Tax=Planococcus halocryophilus TaxID=1215089 RepID=A0A1C7DQ90_9BACL|nr:DegV family protein [Planococcus halocryophilus]ANU13769.1 fatty acid-binding protein DegV [Planococcus halocryophilus]EMF46554.1 DegV family protein [Planococcus halocryophilus Or1]